MCGSCSQDLTAAREYDGLTRARSDIHGQEAHRDVFTTTRLADDISGPRLEKIGDCNVQLATARCGFGHSRASSLEKDSAHSLKMLRGHEQHN